METVLDDRTILFRARIVDKDLRIEEMNPYKEMSPAPIHATRNNRMSPAGISYMYLANKVSTCLHEICAKQGDFVLVGSFVPKKPLKMLDLSRHPHIVIPSIFNPDYDHDLRWMDEFIQSFKREISKPVQDGEKEIEYVPTQVLAEYIRKLGYEGIVYESSLEEGTCNYVLFYGPDPEFFDSGYKSGYWYRHFIQLPFFHEALELSKVDWIEITSPVPDWRIIGHMSDVPGVGSYKKRISDDEFVNYDF